MTPVTPAMARIVLRLPKAELHCHLDGSLRARTLHELALENDIDLPVSVPSTLGDWMRVDDARNLDDYLSRFDVTLAVMQDEPSLERIAYELVVDAALDGVRYIEIRFCPALSTKRSLTSSKALEAIVRGAYRGELETGTVARHIVCALRTFPVDHAMAMAQLAIEHRGPVVAFDLAGGEEGNPPSRFAKAFELVRNHDLAITVHAGEGAGAESIRDAIHGCGANRIGHGTRLLEDQSLMQYVIDRQIPLEICPTSNVQTRVTATFAEHPLALYLANGAVVTLNTDNRLMSGVSLTDEYLRCVEYLDLDFDSLCGIALSSFDASFLSFAERQLLRRAAASEIEQLVSDPSLTEAFAP